MPLHTGIFQKKPYARFFLLKNSDSKRIYFYWSICTSFYSIANYILVKIWAQHEIFCDLSKNVFPLKKMESVFSSFGQSKHIEIFLYDVFKTKTDGFGWISIFENHLKNVKNECKTFICFHMSLNENLLYNEFYLKKKTRTYIDYLKTNRFILDMQTDNVQLWV